MTPEELDQWRWEQAQTCASARYKQHSSDWWDLAKDTYRRLVREDVKHWSIKTALEQIQSCNFECEAGPLANNVGWQWLEAAAKVGPEFWPGQGVWFEVEATAAGKTLRQWVHFFIVGCTMTSDTERRLWTYNLSYDPPAPWHYGTTHFTGVSGSKLRLEKPEGR